MKRIYLLLILFVSLSVSWNISCEAQELDSFEAYKKAEQERFRKFKERDKKMFEAFKRNELDWNKEILGYEVETPVSDPVMEKDKHTVVKPSIPEYVNLQANLNDEIVQLKRRLKKIKEADTLKMKSAPQQMNEISHKMQSAPLPKKAEKMKNAQQTTTQKREKIKTPTPTSTASQNIKLASNYQESLIEVEKRSIPSKKPIYETYRLSSKFGNRFHPTLFRWRFHGGVDMACPKGTDIHVPADGVIVKSGWNGGYGNYIKVKHGNGFETVYGHLSKISVKNGQKVKQGDVIGKVGSTGRSTGSHLHYEIIKNKKRVNPERFFG